MISIAVIDASALDLLDKVGEAEKAKFKFKQDHSVHRIYSSLRRFLFQHA